MKKESTACVDPAFYTENYREGGFEEARAVLIGMYLEKELEERRMQPLKLHLDRCSCCTLFLKDLENFGEFRATEDVVPFALCPSSEMLDSYLFDRSRLSAEQTARIEKHLGECHFCKEESNWLEGLESKRTIEFQPAAAKRYFGLAIAAAVFFATLASIFWWQKTQDSLPAEKLRALAVIKEPHQIDYASLNETSAPLGEETIQTYNRAVIFFQKGNFRQAAPLFEEVLRRTPDHSASLYLLGNSYYRLNDAEKAFALCDRAERIHPHSYERCLSLVHIALKTGHFDRALLEITALYHGDPDVPEVRDLYRQITSLTRGNSLKM